MDQLVLGLEQVNLNFEMKIPNDKVGFVVGNGGVTIRSLEANSGARIRLWPRTDKSTRTFNISGTEEQIEAAKQLVNEVIREAEVGGSGLAKRLITGQAGAGAGQFEIKFPYYMAGFVVGDRGQTIRSIKAKSGAGIRLWPRGDKSIRKTLHLSGTQEQIEAAKQLVNEVLREAYRWIEAQKKRPRPMFEAAVSV